MDERKRAKVNRISNMLDIDKGTVEAYLEAYNYDEDNTIKELKNMLPNNTPKKRRNTDRDDNLTKRSKMDTHTFFDSANYYREEPPDDSDEKFQKLFSPPFDIQEYGSFDQIKQKASKSNKWVLINIQDNDNFDSLKLNRDLWKNEAVKSIIKESFIFWQIHNTQEESNHFKLFYNVSVYPFVGIIHPRTGELVKSLKCVYETPDLLLTSIVSDLIDFLDNNVLLPLDSYNKTSVAKDEDEKYFDLISDHEDDVEDVTLAPKPSPDTTAATTVESVNINTPPTEEEQYKIVEVPDDETQNISSIKLVFPDGKFVLKKFYNNSKVGELFVWTKNENEKAKEKKFELIQRFPKKELSNCKDKTIEECNLGNSTIALRWVD